MTKSLFVRIIDFAFAPLRLAFLSDEASKRLGMTSLEDERLNNVLPFVKGRLLDIGCGRNRLVKRYGNGTGVDVYDWGGGALIVKDTAELPFEGASFDTVTIIAALNHIPNRVNVLREARRVLRPGGKLIITMINPLISYIGHKYLWWYSEEKERGMEEGEVYGFWNKDVIVMVKEAGFELALHRRFVYGLNNLFVFNKA